MSSAQSSAARLTLSFVRDWLVTVGWIRPDNSTYRIWRARLKMWSLLWLPVGLRILAAGLVSLLVMDLFSGASHLPAAANLLIALVGALGGLAVLLGLATRSASGLVSLASYVDYAFGGQPALGLPLLFISSLLIVLGSGHFTLWIPEESWLRIGAVVEE